MSAPHFRTDAAAAAAFDARVAKDPAGAVLRVLQAGLSIREADVPTPHIDALAAIGRVEVEQRRGYESRHGGSIAQERTALARARGCDAWHRRQGEEAVQARAAERAAFVARRASELEAADLEARRAAWRAEAEHEFDSAHAAQQPKPPAPTKRKAA